MSYLRYNTALRFVDGISEDYIFPCDNPAGKTFVEDYGKISNESLVELICKLTEKNDDPLLREYLIKHLAKKLNVKLRKKPLTPTQACDLTIKEHKRIEKTKKYKQFVKDIGFK